MDKLNNNAVQKQFEIRDIKFKKQEKGISLFFDEDKRVKDFSDENDSQYISALLERQISIMKKNK